MIYRLICLNQLSKILGHGKFHTQMWNDKKICYSSVTNMLQKKKCECECEYEPCKFTMVQPV